MMTSENQSKIHKFLYNLSTQNYNGADTTLKDILKQKVDARFASALNAVKEGNSGENRRSHTGA